MHKSVFAAYLAVVFLLTKMTMAQTPNEGAEKLRVSTAKRGLEELLSAIDTRDGSNLDIVAIRGMMASGSEPYSVFLQIVRDERVRKIYSLLESMPRDQAAVIVAKSYNKTLSALKAHAREDKLDEALRYGLHAKLWLSYQFEPREDFNRRFSDWNDWYVDYLTSGKYLATNKEVPEPWRKSSFARSSSPELLMYLNLALIDQVKNGKVDDQSEIAKMWEEAGCSVPLSKSYIMLPMLPYDAEIDPTKRKDVAPLLTLPVLMHWDTLCILDHEQRIELINKVRRKFLDPPGVIESAIDDLALYLLSLGGTADLESLGADLKKLQEMSPKNGTAIAFLGSSHEGRLVQGWYAERPPTKKQFLRAVERLVELTPPDERDEWNAIIQEVKDWLSEIPDSGLEVKEQKVLVWPKPEATESNTDKKTEPGELRLRLVLRKTRAFTGQLDDDEPKSKTPGRTNGMHAKPDLRVFLKWRIAGSGSVIPAVRHTSKI